VAVNGDREEIEEWGGLGVAGFPMQQTLWIVEYDQCIFVYISPTIRIDFTNFGSYAQMTAVLT
jgi:hypothetical protein